MPDNRQLLAEYVNDGSEAAFRELVARYTGLVYSAAVRLTGGDAHRARDISQTVFVDLARKAETLSRDSMLGGWLHRHTCWVAATVMRGERRRQARERQVVEMNSMADHSKANLEVVELILDEAINQLGAEDRMAILLRFFEQQDLRTVGDAMGTSENAARMRVTRALEKLHSYLKHRGVVVSAAALAAALASEAVTAAPIGLAAGLTTAALAATAAGTGTITLLKIMTMTHFKIGAISALVLAGVAAPLVVQQRSKTRLHDQNEALRSQLQQLTQASAERERISNLAAQAGRPAVSNEQALELLRLRGEVGVLRRQAGELAKLREENHQLQAGLARSRDALMAKAPADSAAQDDFPKESWSFAGYDTPDSALQSWTWAMYKGDRKAMRASLTPAGQQEWEKVWANKSDGDPAAEAARGSSKITGYQIRKRETVSDNEVVIHLSMNGSSQEMPMKITRIGSEWKIAGPAAD